MFLLVKDSINSGILIPVIASSVSNPLPVISVTHFATLPVPSLPPLSIIVTLSICSIGLATSRIISGNLSTNNCRIAASSYLDIASANLSFASASAIPFALIISASASPASLIASASACAISRLASASACALILIASPSACASLIAFSLAASASIIFLRLSASAGLSTVATSSFSTRLASCSASFAFSCSTRDLFSISFKEYAISASALALSCSAR